MHIAHNEHSPLWFDLYLPEISLVYTSTRGGATLSPASGCGGGTRWRVDLLLAFLTPLRASPHLTLACTWMDPLLLLAMGVLVGTIVIIICTCPSSK